jgi:hypothetical protein
MNINCWLNFRRLAKIRLGYRNSAARFADKIGLLYQVFVTLCFMQVEFHMVTRIYQIAQVLVMTGVGHFWFCHVLSFQNQTLPVCIPHEIISVYHIFRFFQVNLNNTSLPL